MRTRSLIVLMCKVFLLAKINAQKNSTFRNCVVLPNDSQEIKMQPISQNAVCIVMPRLRSSVIDIEFSAIIDNFVIKTNGVPHQNTNAFSTRFSCTPHNFQTIFLLETKTPLPQNHRIEDYIHLITADSVTFRISEDGNIVPDVNRNMFSECYADSTRSSAPTECRIENTFLIRRIYSNIYRTIVWCVTKLTATSAPLYAYLPDEQYKSEIFTTGIPYRISNHKDKYYNLNGFNHTLEYPQLITVLPGFQDSPRTDYLVYKDTVFCQNAFTKSKTSSTPPSTTTTTLSPIFQFPTFKSTNPQSPTTRRPSPQNPIDQTTSNHQFNTQNNQFSTVNHQPSAQCGVLSNNVYPWQVTLHLNSATTPNCVGTAIGSNSILTAASCVIQNGQIIATNTLTVHTIAQNSNNPAASQILQVAEIIAHPLYNGEYLDNDLAIIKLRRGVGESNIIPICLWSNETITGRNGVLVGFNSLESVESMASWQHTPVTIAKNKHCRNNDLFLRKYLSAMTVCGEFINDSNICPDLRGSGFYFVENSKWYLGGSVSIGASTGGRCSSSLFTLFTNVPYFNEWILSNL